MTEDKRFRKNFIWNMLGMTFNSFSSFFYMLAVTRLNGTSEAGVFTLAFSIACLIYFIGVYAGRVFQVTEVDREISDNDFIAHRIISCTLMMIVSIGYSLFMHYSGTKLCIVLLLCVYKMLEAASEVFYGILQKNTYLYKVGFSYTLKSIISVILFVAVDFITRNIILSILTIICVWLIVLLLYDIPSSNKIKKISISFNINHVLTIFRTGFFLFAVSFLSVYIVNAPKYALDGRVSDSMQAIFGIVVMPATLVSLAAQYFIQPYLQSLTTLFAQNKQKEYNKVVIKLLLMILGIGIVCEIVAFLLGIPVLSAVYSVDLSAYKADLLIIIAGAILYSMSIIISTALTTVRYTFSQFVVYAIASLVGLLLSGKLIDIYGVHGATYSYFVIMCVQLLSYTVVYLFMQKKLFAKLSEISD